MENTVIKSRISKWKPKMYCLIKQIPKKINQRIQQSKTEYFVKCHGDKITAIGEQYQPQVVEHGRHSERE